MRNKYVSPSCFSPSFFSPYSSPISSPFFSHPSSPLLHFLLYVCFQLEHKIQLSTYVFGVSPLSLWSIEFLYAMIMDYGIKLESLFINQQKHIFHSWKEYVSAFVSLTIWIFRWMVPSRRKLLRANISRGGCKAFFVLLLSKVRSIYNLEQIGHPVLFFL